MEDTRRISKSTHIACYCIITIFLIMCVFLIKDLDFTNWTSYISLLIIALAILQFVVLKNFINFFSISSFFLILSYLFHFGLIINMGLFPFFEDKNVIYLYKLDLNIVKQAVMLCYYSISVIGLSFVLFNKLKVKKRIIKLKALPKSCLLFGLILVVLSLPFVIYQFYTSISAYINGNYLDTFDELGSGAGVIAFMRYVFLGGVSVLITYYSRINKSKAYAVFIISCFYICLQILFTGGRGLYLLNFVCLFLILYYNKLFKFTPLKIFLVILILYLSAAAMNALADVRDYDFDIKLFLISFLKYLNGTALLGILQEAGGSIYTPYLCILQAGKVYNTAYGLTYLSSLVTVLPNIGGVFSNIIQQSSFVTALDGTALGGSYIGEAYFNFGYFGILFMLAIGFIVNCISNKLESAVYKNNYFNIALLFPLSSLALWWVRDAANGFVREIVWGYLVLGIIYFFIKLIKGKDSFVEKIEIKKSREL